MNTQRRVGGAEASPAPSRRRVLGAAIAASSIEWYDFLIYGVAATLVIHSHFFPEVSSTAGVLAAFATFAVGFAGRPIGAALFGHIGDRLGRKPALLTAMFLMATCSTLIGLLPTYATIGVAAPIILVILRIAQGMAVGGHWGGATLLAVEYAPPERRAFYGALPQLGLPTGMITGTLLFLLLEEILTPGQLSLWGWRIPFLLSVVMFPVAYFVHRFIEDTPRFRQVGALLVAQVGVGAMFGPAQTMLAQMFPPEVRYSGASLGYQIANILGGGLAPLIMTALLAATGTTLAVSGYVAAACVLALIPLSLATIVRTRRRSSRQDDHAAVIENAR
ncbi:MFS transporter [Saccharomonospora sp. NPDC046836]|uniref:MFS transporter n=1 Tax=Saccharomonospora sp. NPDC046836 TaxID=3156921 RepID=UPI003411DC5C